MLLFLLGGRLDLPDETSAAISGFPLGIENMFVDLRMASFSAAAAFPFATWRAEF